MALTSVLILAIPLVAYANSLRKVETKNEKEIAENIKKEIDREPTVAPFPRGEYQVTTPAPKTPQRASTKPTTPIVSTQSEQWYKIFIYNHESGNDPKRWNTSGCVGLGQACPASKLLAVCPTLDYACEDRWFTNYAISRYGSWYNAYRWWIAHRWW